MYARNARHCLRWLLQSSLKYFFIVSLTLFILCFTARDSGRSERISQVTVSFHLLILFRLTVQNTCHRNEGKPFSFSFLNVYLKYSITSFQITVYVNNRLHAQQSTSPARVEERFGCVPCEMFNLTSCCSRRGAE